MMHHHSMQRTHRLIAHCMLVLLATLLHGLAWADALPLGTLPPPVAQALAQAGMDRANVSVWAQAVDAARPTLVVNADRPMNPASVMKLVTTFAALERLGPGHSWETRVLVRGRIAQGVLHGDLAIAGSGDPVLDFPRLWKLLRQVKAQGIGEIRGDIVLDGGTLAQALPPHDPARFDGRGLRPYNSGPAGMLMHFNTLNLSLIPPERPGSMVTVIAQQPLAGLALDARIVSSEGACGTWHAALEARMETDADGDRLVLSGNLPHSCGRREWAASPFPPARHAAALVAGLWAELGGILHGEVRVGRTPDDALLILGDSSPALADVVREMNKWSSNVIARQLLASLGAADPADAVAAGARVAAQTLAAAGIDTTGLVIDNGSGLSRIERIRADSLGRMLLAVWARPYMPEFIASLPVAGMDGTARRRLADSPARGRAHIKTGTIDAVRAFAGYVLDRDGRRHVVVMMVNDPRAADSRAAQDALLDWLWQGGR